MSNAKINNLLIPNVSTVGGAKGAEKSNKLKGSGDVSEFKELLNKEVLAKSSGEDIHLSVHAAKRLKERNLSLDSEEFFKLKGAIEKLKSKGGQDSLVITDKAAYIVDVNKNTIVTAMDKANMMDNVFTKIDSTLLV